MGSISGNSCLLGHRESPVHSLLLRASQGEGLPVILTSFKKVRGRLKHDVPLPLRAWSGSPIPEGLGP